MPFNRPTLRQLKAQAAGDIATAVPNADALLRFSNLGVMGKVLSGLVNGLYGFLDWIAAQAVPFTATQEYLEGWAALKGIYRKPATGAGVAAGISVQFNGANGTPLPVNWPLTRSDGASYAVTSGGVVAGGVVTVLCAAVDTGSSTDCVIGQVMNLASAIAGINVAGAVTAAGSAGSDIETDDELRGRTLQAYQAPPMGGADADYRKWALEVAGVTRAWVAPLEGGAGTVSVYFMMDDTESAFGGFPQGLNGVAANETRAAAATGDQLAVANAIYPLRPVTALVTAKAPAPNTIDFTINGLTGAPPAAVQASISAAIVQVFLSQGAPGGVVDDTGAAIGGVALSYVEAAIAAIAGTAGFVITDITASAGVIAPGSAGNIGSNAGCLPVLGAITYAA